jgi:hypothetical protein
VIGGSLFAVLGGAYAVHMTASKWHPESQIGIAGIAWSLALLTYFIWRFTSASLKNEVSR